MTAAAVLKLQNSGFSQAQVEAIGEYFDTQAATRTDLVELKAELKGDIAELRQEIGVLRDELRQEIATVRAEARRDTAELKAHLVKWVLGIGFAQVAMLLAFLRLIPGSAP